MQSGYLYTQSNKNNQSPNHKPASTPKSMHLGIWFTNLLLLLTRYSAMRNTASYRAVHHQPPQRLQKRTMALNKGYLYACGAWERTWNSFPACNPFDHAKCTLCCKSRISPTCCSTEQVVPVIIVTPSSQHVADKRDNEYWKKKTPASKPG